MYVCVCVFAMSTQAHVRVCVYLQMSLRVVNGRDDAADGQIWNRRGETKTGWNRQ